MNEAPNLGLDIVITGRALDGTSLGRRSPSTTGTAKGKTPESTTPFHVSARLDRMVLRDSMTLAPFTLEMSGTGQRPRTLSLAGSLSKTYAMTGWRIGFGLVPSPIVQAMTKLQSHSTSNPCSISQKAAVEALRGPQESVGVMLAEYRKRRDFVVARLRTIPGVRCNQPQGAFYVYPNVSVAIGKNGIDNTLQFSERLLAEAHVAVVPGEAFGTDAHIRISYATSIKELDRGLERIHQFIVKNS